jgi:hypothetical protein
MISMMTWRIGSLAGIARFYNFWSGTGGCPTDVKQQPLDSDRLNRRLLLIGRRFFARDYEHLFPDPDTVDCPFVFGIGMQGWSYTQNIAARMMPRSVLAR